MFHKLLKYAAYMFGTNALTAGLNFGVSALGMITRPKGAFGDYAIYMLIYGIGCGVFIFGANSTIQKFGAGDPVRRIKFCKLSYLLFVGLLVLAGCIAVPVYVWLGGNVALALLGLPFVVVWWWGRYILRSTLEARSEAHLMALASLSNTLFQFLFLTLTDLRDALIYGDFLALLASGIAALWLLPRSLKVSAREILRVSLTREEVQEWVRFAMPVWWAGQVFSAKNQLGSIFTTAYLGRASMGTLQAAQTMWQFAGKPTEYVGQAALPALVASNEDRDELFLKICRFCLVIIPLVGLAVAVGIPVLFAMLDMASGLLGWTGLTLGQKYAEVPTLLCIMALATPFLAVEMVSNQYSVSLGRPRAVLIAQIVNVVCLAAGLWFLARPYGLWGVLVGGLIGEMCNAATFIVVLWSLKGEVFRRVLSWAARSVLVLASSMAAYFSFGLSPMLAPFCAIAVYVVLCGALGLVRFEDFRSLIALRRGEVRSPAG